MEVERGGETSRHILIEAGRETTQSVSECCCMPRLFLCPPAATHMKWKFFFLNDYFSSPPLFLLSLLARPSDLPFSLMSREVLNPPSFPFSPLERRLALSHFVEVHPSYVADECVYSTHVWCTTSTPHTHPRFCTCAPLLPLPPLAILVFTPQKCRNTQPAAVHRTHLNLNRIPNLPSVYLTRPGAQVTDCFALSLHLETLAA